MLSQYKIVYRHNGGKFQTFIDSQTLEKAIAEFRRKSAFSLVLIMEVSHVKTYPLDEEMIELINVWCMKVFGVFLKPKSNKNE